MTEPKPEGPEELRKRLREMSDLELRVPSGEGDTLPILASPGYHTCDLQYVVTDGKTFFHEEKRPSQIKM